MAVKAKTPDYLECCRDLLTSGYSAAADAMLSAYMKKHTIQASTVTLMGQIQRALGNTELALRYFRQADVIDPGYIPARILVAETLAADGKVEAAKKLLYDTSDWHPTDGNILQEIATLTSGPEDYHRLYRQWMGNRKKGMTASSGARAVAKAATLVDEFDAAQDIFRWLIRSELARVAKNKAKNVFAQPKPVTGRVGDGKGDAALEDLKKVLDAHNTRFFLISGTLLGYLRDGQMIAGDKDIDIGIFQEEYDYKTLERVFRNSSSFVVKRLDNTDRLRVSHVNGVWVDIFPHYKEGERVYHDGTASRWWNTPFGLKTMTINKMDYLVPDPPERYLDENYGDWRTPVFSFDVRYEAPNAEIVSRKYFDYLIYVKVFESLQKANWPTILKYGNDLAYLFQNDALMEQSRGEAAFHENLFERVRTNQIELPAPIVAAKKTTPAKASAKKTTKPKAAVRITLGLRASDAPQTAQTANGSGLSRILGGGPSKPAEWFEEARKLNTLLDNDPLSPKLQKAFEHAAMQAARSFQEQANFEQACPVWFSLRRVPSAKAVADRNLAISALKGARNAEGIGNKHAALVFWNYLKAVEPASDVAAKGIARNR